MKKISIILLFFCFFSNSLAGSFVGLNFHASYLSTKEFNLKLGPILSILISKKWEFAPSIQFTSTYVSTEQNDQNYSTTQYGIGFGCGFFRQFINSNSYRFSLGPDIYYMQKFKPITKNTSNGNTTNLSPDDYSNYTIGFGMPANVDFKLSERLILRLSARIVTIDYNHTTDGGLFKFEIESFSSPSFTFYCRF